MIDSRLAAQAPMRFLPLFAWKGRTVAHVKMLFGLGAMALSLGACAVGSVETGDSVWYKEGATIRERDAALSAAESQAAQVRADPAQQARKDIVLKSMTAQGWRLIPKDKAPPLQPESSRKPANP